MMKFSKISKRVAACTLAGAMMVSMLGMTAFAKTGNLNEGETVSFTKTLNMSEAPGASVPNVEFTYTITPITKKIDATPTSPEILPGIAGAEIGKAEYSYKETAATTIDKIVSVNFGKVTWPAPGIYRYIITEETTSGNDDIINDENPTRYLDVYVVNDGNGGYKIASQALTTSDAAPTKESENGVIENKYTGKSDGFTNKYKTYGLTLKKMVDGTMGDKGRKYKFTINFVGPENISFKMGDTTVNLGTTGSASVSGIELSNEESVSFIGIPSNVNYTIVENIAENEGYTVGYEVTETKDEKETKTNIKSGTYATSNVKIMGKSNNSVVCTNTKNAVSPTGVALTVAPYLVMVAAAGILAILFFRRRHGEA